jgi:glycerol transport system substrate-binding protein
LRKTIVGLTPIRDSDIRSAPMDEMAPKLAGLVEFYRSPARVAWTPTGVNVPDYPKLAQLWWANVAEAVTGEKTAQEAMDNLAKQQDQILARLERAKIGGECAPKLGEEQTAEHWFEQPGAPFPKLENEKPQGVTVDYDRLVGAWRDGKVMPDGVKG